MPSYNITARKTSPITPVTLTAVSREEAIQQVIKTAAPGEEIEVLQVLEVPGSGAGATGATGPAR